MDSALLLRSVIEWQEYYLSTRLSLIPRFSIKLPSKSFALALLGVRRCGKTTAAIECSKILPVSKVFYYNFEDPLFKLENNVLQLQQLLDLALQNNSENYELLILDEIQNVPGWERWLRTLIDRKQFRIIVTGSSAALLSGELASSLTGRAIEQTIWPLSFKEFLNFRKTAPKSINDTNRQLIDYLKFGGFPEPALNQDLPTRKKLLQAYLGDILLKDVLGRERIRNKRALDQISTYYLTNLSSLHSYTAISKAYGLSTDLVADYSLALTNAFLMFELYRYHSNLKVQTRDPKKVYVVDTGLRNIGSRSIQDDTGKLLENIVCLELFRREKKLTYYKGKQEVDFVEVENGQAVAAIQVCLTLDDPNTREREIRGLLECLNELDLAEGTIITWERKEKLTVDGKKILIIPAGEWLSTIG